MIKSQLTIPCPGQDDASNFTDIDLKERPILAKVLQHGWNPRLVTPMLGSKVAPAPAVNADRAFVERRFRTLDASRCKYDTTKDLFCRHSNMAQFGPGPSVSLTEKQFRLGLGLSYDPQNTAKMLDILSYLAWARHFHDWMVEFNATCNQDSSLWVVRKTHACAAALMDCHILEDAFINDLKALPSNASGDPTLLEAYESFNEKWGYGTVDGFDFGLIEWTVSLQNDEKDELTQLYMGRAGGTANFTFKSVYTDEECMNPSPININYRDWADVLHLLVWNQDGVEDLDVLSLADNFDALSANSPSLFQQIRNAGLSNVNCPEINSLLTPEPTTNPMDFSTDESTPHPTADPRGDPTDEPTLNRVAVPTNKPTIRPSIEATSRPTADSTLGPTKAATPSFDPSANPTDEPTAQSSQQTTIQTTVDSTSKQTVVSITTNQEDLDRTDSSALVLNVHPNVLLLIGLTTSIFII